MKRLWLPIAAALVVLVNAFVLAGVAYNRAAGPRVTVALTHRELPLASTSLSDESSEVALHLDTEHWRAWQEPDASEPYDEQPWLDQAKLAALGFDVRLPAGDDAAAYRVRPSRRAYAVLELAGPAWRRWEQGLRVDLARSTNAYERERLQRELRSGSRLFIVDVGPDPAALRARHADGRTSFVLPATVSVYFEPAYRGRPARLRGRVELLVPQVNVPRRLHGVLAAAQRARARSDGELGPAEGYDVVLGIGARQEPWIVALTPAAGR